MKRPTILVFNRTYLPGFKSGGPIRSLVNLVGQLSDEFEFRIVTRDRDSGDQHAYPGVMNDWIQVGPAKVRYLNPRKASLQSIARILRSTQHDIIYLNSFFDPLFTQKVLAIRRLSLAPCGSIVLAPRGEFSEGALSLHALKKRLYKGVARMAGLYRDITWQASNELEATSIRREASRLGRGFKGTRVVIAGNVTLPPKDGVNAKTWRPRARGESLRVCFIGRIVPMKNLDYALKVLGQLELPVTFSIFGPKEDEGYWAKCKVEMGRLPSNIQVRDEGQLVPDRVSETLEGFDLLFLPTLGENFGHVISEALQSRVPVLISDQTPWKHLQSAGVGWSLPLDRPGEFLSALRMLAETGDAGQTEMRARCAAYAESVGAGRNAVLAHRNLFRGCVRRGDA